jgi:pyruvate carboxylase subunit B
MDKFPSIIKAMGEVVRCGGYGTSVTPVSQFYFQQAFNNVMFGPWEKIADGYGKMVLGYFGKTPVSPDPMVVKLAAEQLELEPTTRTPLDINDEDPTKGLEPARKRLKEEDIEDTEENVFIVATCKDKGIDFLKGNATLGIRKVDLAAPAGGTPAPAVTKPAKPAGTYTVTVSGHKYSVRFDGNHAHVNDKAYVVDLKEEAAAKAEVTPKQAGPAGEMTDVQAPMPGVVIQVSAAEGGHVNEGDPVLILEAMKMEMKVPAPVSGTLSEVCVAKGDQVATAQVLARIEA